MIKFIVAVMVLAMVLFVGLGGCSRNVLEAKACAPVAFKQAGFEIIGYEGYTLSAVFGGLAWYTVRRIPDNGIVYEVAVTPWNGECHIYNLSAVDAIKPT